MPTVPHDENRVADNTGSTSASNLRIEYSSDRTKIWCNKRQKWVAARGEGFEEEVRQLTLIDLVTHYRYPMVLIGVERPVRVRVGETPRRADIVIYKELSYQKPLAVIENKRPATGPGIDQAQIYATILGAEYAKYTDNNENRTRRLAYGLGHTPEVIEIPDIPSHGMEVVYEIDSLIPFSDIKTTLTSCHKALRDMGKDPVESFKIMSKLVVAKIFDERGTPASGTYQMQCGRNESDAEIAQRVRALYVTALTSMTSRNEAEPLSDMELELDDHTLATLVQRIQRYSFIKTDVDSKGAVFETFIDAAFRGPFGQYFTPRTIVDFMVRLIDPKESDLVIDPACGSGGFLVYILDHVRRTIQSIYTGRLSSDEIDRKVFEFAQDKLVGIDIATLPQFAAKVNMLVNGDGRGNIYCRNALMPLRDLPSDISRKAGQFSVAITNPPFGVTESHEEYLAGFKTALDANDSVKPKQDTKILFIERCLQLVAPGGLVMIVLPNGILNNPSADYVRVRDFMRSQATIKAVIRLRDDAFLHTGTGSRTSLVLMQRKRRGDVQGDIFMAWAPNVGYDKKGRPAKSNGQPVENDLPLILQKYQEWKSSGHIETGTAPLVFALPVSDQEDSLDPRYYDPGLRSDLRALRSRMTMTRLGDLLMTAVPPQLPTGTATAITSGSDSADDDEPDTSKVVKGKASRAYTPAGVRVMMITQMKKVNQVYLLDQDGSRFISQSDHDEAILSKLKPKDILLAITGATIGKVVMVPSDISHANICPDIARIRIDPVRANPYYVFAFLTSALGYRYLRSRVSGSTNEHLAPQAIENIAIPMPDEATQSAIGEEYKSSLAGVESSRRHVAAGLTKLASALLVSLPTLSPPETPVEIDVQPTET